MVIHVDPEQGDVSLRRETPQGPGVTVGWVIHTPQGSLTTGAELRLEGVAGDPDTGFVLRYRCDAPAVALRVRLRGTDGGLESRLELENPGPDRIQVQKIEDLALGADPLPGEGGERILVDSGIAGGCGVREVGAVPMVSSFQTVLYRPASGDAVLVGFLAYEAGDHWIELRPGSKGGAFLTAVSKAPGDLEPGATWTGDPLWLAAGRDPLGLLEAHGARVRDTVAPPLPAVPLAGYLTWYAFRTDLDEATLLRAARWSAEFLSGYPQPMVRVFLVDHGWTPRAELGTWTQADADRFPRGMQAFVDDLGSLGLETGLWYAPLAVTTTASDFAGHEGNFLVGSRGAPVLMKADIWPEGPRETWTLDPGLPSTRARWGRDLAAMNAWGVAFWKLDFFKLGAGDRSVLSVLYSPPAAPTPLLELQREVWAGLRGAVDADDLIMPCTSFTNRNLGRCNVMTVAPDVGNPGAWPEELPVFRDIFTSVAASWFKHGAYWVNDDQSLQVGPGGAAGEARVRATLVAFSGAGFWLGDIPWELPPDRVALLRRCLPVYGRAATPVNLFTAAGPDALPNVWSLPVPSLGDDAVRVVAVFNLAEAPAVIRVASSDLGIASGQPFRAMEWWTSTPLGVHRDTLEVEVGAMDAAVIHAIPYPSHPAILGTDLHYAPGFVLEDVRWDASRGELSGVIRNKKDLAGTLFVSVPAGYRAEPAPGLTPMPSDPAGVLRLNVVTTGDLTPFRLRFRRG